MQIVSKEYAKQIKKVPLRNRSVASVIVGVINKEAQKQVAFDETDNDFLFYSNLETPFKELDNPIVEYATYENNFFRVDGEMAYVSDTNYTNQGAVGETLMDGIKLDLGKEYKLAGLTIDFGTKYPTSIQITLDSEERIVTNDKRVWIYTDSFTTRYITITPLEFVRGNVGRLRIENFKCGYYKEFGNNVLISVSYDETISPISDELSQNELTVKVENYGRKYDVEKENDLTKFFIVGQDINANFGYQLDDGTIEYVDLGNLSLSSWEVDSTTLTLKGTSYINTLDDTCMIGEYSASGKTLYALAVEVFTDLGLEEDEYKIDDRLKLFTTHNPLPQLPHSQLLQLIANAGQCVLMRDREGLYKIIPTAFLDPNDIEFTISDNGHTTDSTPSKIINLENSATTNYIADYSQDYFRVDEVMYWSDNDNQGYISSAVSDENGDFETNPQIIIETNKALQLTGWNIDFVGAIPEKVNITSYYNNVEVVSQDFDVISRDMSFQEQFGYCDKSVITILKGSPNARVHIATIKTPPLVFTFTSTRDVVGSSKAKIDDLIKNIELDTTIYTVEESTEEAFTTDIEIENGLDYSEWEVIFNAPIIPDQVKVNDAVITPLAITGQHCILDLSSFSEGDTVTVTVSGNQLSTKTKTYRTNINEKGVTNSYQNPLIDSDSLAKDNLTWLGIFNSYNKKYTIPNRGYPELEANDLVGLEIPQLNNLAAIRITSHKISFVGGALSGTDSGIRENIPYLNN